MQAAAVEGAPALASLLKGANSWWLEAVSAGVEEILHCFLYPFKLGLVAQHSTSVAPLIDKLWQRVQERPMALAATVEAFQACHMTDSGRVMSEQRIADAINMHVCYLASRDAEGQIFEGWLELLGSDSVQQYALEALAPLPDSSEATPLLHSLGPWSQRQFPFLTFLNLAAGAGKMCGARLRALAFHEGILSHPREAAAGRLELGGIGLCALTLRNCWTQICLQRSSPGRSAEARGAAQSAMMAPLRQLAAILQLRAVPPDQQQRAVQRAQRHGFLQARPSIA